MNSGLRSATKRPKLILGLMSGTSADGIDVALVRIGARGTGIAGSGARLENFATLRFPAQVRKEVLRVAEGVPVSSGEISQLNFRLGEVFARALLEACRKFRVNPRKIGLIGSHGQTVYHQGVPSRFLGATVSSTLQIGEPAVIAALTGITTVADFRPADMAAGGQGAPLVPWVDYLLFHDARRGRVVLNIGGIANVTVIPERSREGEVFAFDTGPGNMLIDGLTRLVTQGKQSFDRDAKLASTGTLIPGLLEDLLAAPYFRISPPKTTGREQYGKEAVERLLHYGKEHRSKPADLIRTATIFTALSIVDAFQRWILPKGRIHDLIISGGGARNPLIMAQLAASLPGVAIVTSGEMGVPGDAKEALAFALLANETALGRPSNLPRATGAKRSAILGKICYPPPQRNR